MKVFTIMAILFLMMSSDGVAEAHNHKAHVHGAAKLTLAIEDDGKTGSVDLDVSGDSIMGFEHEAKTVEEEKAKVTGFEKLRAGGNQVMKFNSSLDCKVTATKVEIEKENPGETHDARKHGTHSDINAAYEVKCENPLNGTSVQSGLFVLFPKIKSVSIQILTQAKQSSTEVKDAGSPVAIP